MERILIALGIIIAFGILAKWVFTFIAVLIKLIPEMKFEIRLKQMIKNHDNDKKTE